MRTLYEATHCSQLIHQPAAQARVRWIGFEFFESCRMATSNSGKAVSNQQSAVSNGGWRGLAAAG